MYAERWLAAVNGIKSIAQSFSSFGLVALKRSSEHTSDRIARTFANYFVFPYTIYSCSVESYTCLLFFNAGYSFYTIVCSLGRCSCAFLAFPLSALRWLLVLFCCWLNWFLFISHLLIVLGIASASCNLATLEPSVLTLKILHLTSMQCRSTITDRACW